MLTIKSKRELQKFFSRMDSDLNTVGLNVISDYKRLIAEVENRIKTLLLLQGDKAESMALADSIAIVNSINSILVEAGLGNVIQNYQRNFAKSADEAMKYFELIGVEESNASISPQALNVLVDVYTNDFNLGIQNNLVPRIKRALLDGAAGNATFGDVVASVSLTLTELSTHQVETLIQDSYVRFNRQVLDETAKQIGLDYVWVQGPLDDVTREICESALLWAPGGVPGMGPLEDFEAEFPGYLVQGGGYNCRHVVARIDLETAKSYGYQE